MKNVQNGFQESVWGFAGPCMEIWRKCREYGESAGGRAHSMEKVHLPSLQVHSHQRANRNIPST